jgi:hypothetical protein
MAEIAGLMRRAILEDEEPAGIAREVADLRRRFPGVRYCF